MIDKRISTVFLTLLAAGIISSSHGALPDGIEFIELKGIDFSSPVWFGEIPSQPGRFLVLQKNGTILYIEPDSGDAFKQSVFGTIDVNSAPPEMGLLGLAFHPAFSTNHLYFINYNPKGQLRTIIAQRKASVDFRTDAGQEKVIMEIPQPFTNHKGGCLIFGPDTYLYIGLGDGGDAGDPQGNGQNKGSLLGKILRIDVDKTDSSRNYAIPPDNPFVSDTGARGEIWAYGLRNPWRFSFDRTTGDLWCADVGQDLYEEVDIVRKGDNLGWNTMEGFSCFNKKDVTSPLNSCDTAGITMPVTAIKHPDAESVTGGHVFRGKQSAFDGIYIFGDFITRSVWGLVQDKGSLKELDIIGKAPANISSFSEDLKGTLYIVGYNTGKIYRLSHPDLDVPVKNKISHRIILKGTRRMTPHPILKGYRFSVTKKMYGIDGRAKDPNRLATVRGILIY